MSREDWFFLSLTVAPMTIAVVALAIHHWWAIVALVLP